jgi:hypothetical protein
MLTWYDYLMIAMLSYVISQGIIYSFFFAFIGWVAFVNYMAWRKDNVIR